MDNPGRLTVRFVIRVTAYVANKPSKKMDEGSRFGCAGHRSLLASSRGGGRVQDAAI